MLKFEFRGKHGTFQHQTLQSIGADLCCQEGSEGDKGWSGHDWVFLPGDNLMLPTGLFIVEAKLVPFPVAGQLLPYADVRPRSSLNRKGLIGALGTIDADYRDEIRVILMNTTKEKMRIKPGERIGQIVCHYGFQATEVLQNERKGGFGSTGT